MEPVRYVVPDRPSQPASKPHPNITANHIPQQGVSPQTRKITRTGSGRLVVSGKRFFGQFLIDHWVIRINGEQKKLAFGQNKLSVELPAGVYLITAYTPYLGIHCMQVTAEIEICPGRTTRITYKTVFDLFKNGILKREHA